MGIHSGWSLRQVQIVTRHGDRAPFNVLPHEDVQYLCNAVDIGGVGNLLPACTHDHNLT